MVWNFQLWRKPHFPQAHLYSLLLKISLIMLGVINEERHLGGGKKYCSRIIFLY